MIGFGSSGAVFLITLWRLARLSRRDRYAIVWVPLIAMAWGTLRWPGRGSEAP